MKDINAVFYFPYNWYQYGSVKIRTSKERLGKIKYAEETLLEVHKNIHELTFKANFY